MDHCSPFSVAAIGCDCVVSYVLSTGVLSGAAVLLKVKMVPVPGEALLAALNQLINLNCSTEEWEGEIVNSVFFFLLSN